MPKDHFRRERERRIVGAIQFKNVGRRLSYEGRFFVKQSMIVSQPITEIETNKSFTYTECNEKILTTLNDRENRASITCPRCKETYKLHPPYATHRGETIAYDEVETRVAKGSETQ